jgi:HK97 family phage major capsid protein
MAINLVALRQTKADTLKKATAIFEAAAGRSLTEVERTEYDATMASAKQQQGDIERAEALMEADRGVPVERTINVGTDLATKKPWASVGEQLMAVKEVAVSHGRTVDPRLYAAAQGSNESVDAEGGFLLAPEYSDVFLQRTYEEGMVTSRCQTIPMNSNRLVLNGLDEDSRATGQRYGGIQVYRIAEAGLYLGSKPKFKQVTLTANKLIGLMFATDEILEDTAALAKWASTNFPKAFAFQLDDEAINGTGAGQMLGVLTSGAAIVVAKDTAQPAASVSTTNFTNMDARVWGPSRKNAVWFINADLIAQLYTLTIPGATGTATALYVQGQNKDGYPTILSKPVIPIEQAAAGGTQGDLMLCDMSQYLLGQKEGLKADSSIHVAFLTGEQAFRWTLRNDGQPIPKKPLSPYKGNTTLSPFVTLAARP